MRILTKYLNSSQLKNTNIIILISLFHFCKIIFFFTYFVLCVYWVQKVQKSPIEMIAVHYLGHLQISI